MAYEAMNNAGAMNSRLIVILNDNDMSIAPPVGAMSAYLSQLISSKPFQSVRSLGRVVAKRFPRPIEMAARRAEEYARGLLTGGTLFEEMGFFYVGPIDGHNFDHLLPVLKNVRDADYEGPVLIHCVTQKGQGLRAGGGGGGQVPWRRQVRRRHRQAGQARSQGAGLSERLCQGPDRRGGA